MKIVRVQPIGKGVPSGIFDYFIKDEVEKDDIVEISFNNRTLKGKVLEILDAREHKSALKTGKFALRKAVKIKKSILENEIFLHASKILAERLFSNAGKIASSFLPPKKIVDIIAEADLPFKSRPIETKKGGLPPAKFAIGGDYENRISALRQETRSALAGNSSVIIFAPTSLEASTLFEHIKKGIEGRSFLVNGFQKTEETKEIIASILGKEEPSLVVTTPAFSFLVGAMPIGLIVLEKEGSDAYRNLRAPFADFRLFAEILAEHSGAGIIFSDRLPRIETLYRIDDLTVQEIGSVGKKLQWNNEIIVLADSGQQSVLPDKETNRKKAERKMSAMLAFIKEKTGAGENIFVLSPRRGLSPKTICADCGKTVSCPKCGAPVFLHTKERGGNFFFCHSCGEKKDALSVCASCQSWNLKTFGLGAEALHKWLAEQQISEKIWRIDKDSALSPKKAEKTAEEFRTFSGGVLVGTETALKYIRERGVSHSIIFDPASFFSMPDFRSAEKALRIIVSVRDKAEKSFMIDDSELPGGVRAPLFSGIANDFIVKELSERKRFGFPPFSHLFKIEKVVSADERESVSKYLTGLFEGHKINIMEDRKAVGRKPIILRAMLRLPEKYWLAPDLQTKFADLEKNKFAFEYDPADPF